MTNFAPHCPPRSWLSRVLLHPPTMREPPSRQWLHSFEPSQSGMSPETSKGANGVRSSTFCNKPARQQRKDGMDGYKDTCWKSPQIIPMSLIRSAEHIVAGPQRSRASRTGQKPDPAVVERAIIRITDGNMRARRPEVLAHPRAETLLHEAATAAGLEQRNAQRSIDAITAGRPLRQPFRAEATAGPSRVAGCRLRADTRPDAHCSAIVETASGRQPGPNEVGGGAVEIHLGGRSPGGPR